MALTFKLPRYTTEQLADMVGDQGELIIDSTTNKLVMMDGETLGGIAFQPDERVRSKDFYGPNNRWLFSRDGKIVDINGRPIREMGMNVMEMLCSTAASVHGRGNWAYEELPIMAAHGVRYIRAMAVPSFWNSDYTADYKNNPYIGGPEGYWKEFRKVLDCCYNNGIGVQITVMMTVQTITDHVKGAFIDYTDTNSAAWQELVNYTLQPMIDNIGDHPAFSSWCMVNELNMKAEYKNGAAVDTAHGTLSSYASDNKWDMTKFHGTMTNIENWIRANDPIGRLIVNGNNGRISGYGDNTEFWYKHAKDINQYGDVVCWHHYRGFCGNPDWSNIEQEFIMFRKIGQEMGKASICQEVGYQEPVLNGTPWDISPDANEQCMRIAKAAYNSGTQLTLWWIWRDSGEYMELQPNHSFEWNRECLQIIERYNRKMREEGYIDVPDYPQLTNYDRTTSTIGSDGTGRMTIDTSSIDKTDQFAVSFWLKANVDIPTAGSVISRTNATSVWGDTATAGTTLEIYGGTLKAWNIRLPNPGTGAQWVVGASQSEWTPDSEWIHVTLSYDFRGIINGSYPKEHGLNIYINGKRASNIVTNDRTFSFPANTPWSFFNHSVVDAPLAVKIADLQMFNRALQPQEVKALFLHERIPANSLAARWRFVGGNLTDEVAGITAVTSGGITFDDSWVAPTIPF